MELQKTDPEFMERFRHFAFDEVVKEENQQLDAPTRYLAILAALIGCGGVDAYREMLPAALENGVTPVMVKETVYQAADYLGYGRMLPFLNATNEIFAQMEIALPLPGQATTTSEKAFAYKMKMDAMKRKAGRPERNSSQVATNFDTATEIGKRAGESRDQVFRYIRLTELIPGILQMVDDGKIALTPAVELSYLQDFEQEALFSIMDCDEVTPSLS